MTLRAVIFDVDGTLADTERDGHRVAFNTAFHEAGLDWEWDVPLYGELLAVTGGKERMRAYVEKYRRDQHADQILSSRGHHPFGERRHQSHAHPPGARRNGDTFADLIHGYPLPVYALGGMQVELPDIAMQHGVHVAIFKWYLVEDLIGCPV